MSSGRKVIAPASLSNLACGFDVLGLALDLPADEIVGTRSETPGIRIREITGRKAGISMSSDENIAAVAGNALLHAVGETKLGFDLRIHKHIQGGSGLGSSAASAVGAVVLINEFLGRPFERKELLPFALAGEKMASGTPVGDNIVACLLGGLMLVRDISEFDYHRIYTPPGLFFTIALPDQHLSTLAGRELLNKHVALEDFVHQSANLGAFIIGMHHGDFDLIRRSMKDLIIESQRKVLVPAFDDIQELALSSGALGCSISGSGPAIFSLCQERTQAVELAARIQLLFDQQKIPGRTFTCAIHQDGAQLK